MADRTRVAGLDALRGAAFLSVFAFHSVLAFNIGGTGWLGDIYSSRIGYFVPNHLGAFGVTLFFVISGYCIHRSTRAWRARHADAPAATMWRAYARRRFRRIYPMYVATLVVFYLFADRASVTDLLLHAGLVQTLVPGHVNSINPSLWSLAVEAQLYALYPLLWMAMARFGAAPALGVAGAGSLAWALLVPAQFGDAWWVSLPWRWAFPWVLGAAIAEAGDRVTAPHTWRLGVAAGVSVVLLALSRNAVLYAVVPSLFFAMLVMWTVAHGRVLDARLRPLHTLGVISYALYLVHQPLLDWSGSALLARAVRTTDPFPFAAGSLVVLGVCVLIAAVMERLFRPL